MYEQVDGVAMSSLLGQMIANSFMCHIEEKLENRNKMTAFYKRYVHKWPMFHLPLNFLLTLDEINVKVN